MPKKAAPQPIPSPPQTILNKISNSAILNIIKEKCIYIYGQFPFGGKEHHYQAALETELRDCGFSVQQEVARLFYYQKQTGSKKFQLPHDIRGREDLLLPDQRMIIELKQTAKLTDKEFNQICRYIETRRNYDADWNHTTRGLLINFGDSNLEIWYIFYDIVNQEDSEGHSKIKLTRVKLYDAPKPPITSFLETYDATNTV